MSTPLLAASGITKRYGAVVALREVGMQLRAGRVRAIVGENGAGKSTLTGVLAGLVHPDAGEVHLDGEPVRFAGRRDAIAHGIGLVPQHLSLVGALSLTENFLLGSSIGRVKLGEARRRVRQTASEIGVEVALDVEIERIGLAERQLGEVVIAVAQGARVLLLDEPTSTLGPSEVERLMRTVRQLAERGVAIGLVTHRISEVITAADDVTVLRAGELVHDGSAAELDPATIARMMVGDRITRYENGRRREPGPTVVQVASVHTEHGDHIVDLDDVSLEVRAGEIVGIAGVVGSGQVALADVLSGVRHPARGTVRVDGHDVTGDAATATRLGVAYIPESRDDGLHPVGTVAENASLLEIAAIRPAWRRRDRKAERAHGVAVCERFEVRPPDPDLPTVGLSGGNRQKLLVGRELIRGPRVVIAHGPTQGLDLAAGAAVRRELVAAAEQGAAVLVVSADLDEVLELADRVVVLAAGRVADELVPGDDGWDLDRLGAAMAGMNQEAR